MPNPLSFLTSVRPDMLGYMQQSIQPGPAGIAALLSKPGVSEGLLAAGLNLLASDQKRETFGQSLLRSVSAGVSTGREAATREKYEDAIKGLPPEMATFLGMLRPEQGAALLAERAMAGGPAPVALASGADLVDPTTGALIATNDDPANPDRDIRTVGGALVEVTPEGVQTLYETPEEGPDFNEVSALRREFSGKIAPYTEAANAYRGLEAAATGEATPAKDIALVFQFMKTIEPGSTVREGEFATAQNAGSAFDIVGNLYNRLLTGQRLNPQQRTEFLSAARERLVSQLPAYQTVADEYRGIVERNGFNPADVISNPFAGLNLAGSLPTGGPELSDDEIWARVRGR